MIKSITYICSETKEENTTIFFNFTSELNSNSVGVFIECSCGKCNPVILSITYVCPKTNEEITTKFFNLTSELNSISVNVLVECGVCGSHFAIY